MTRRLLTRLGGMATVLVALSLGASACGLAPYVVKVNGHVITRSELFTQMKAISASPSVVSNLSSQGLTVHGKAKGSYSTAFADYVIGQEISIELVNEGLAKRKVTVTPELTTLARDTVVSTAGGAKQFAALPKAYQSYLISSTAQITALQGSLEGVPLTQASVDSYFKAHPADFATACVSIIVLATQPKATSIAKQLNKGASFATLAMKDSVDTQTGSAGGVVGCAVPVGFSHSFGSGVSGAAADLAVGKVSAPLHVSAPSGQSYYILAKVTSRTPGTLSGSVSNVLGALLNPSSAKLTTYLAGLTKAAKIQVDPSYGKYTTNNSGNPDILAPTAPPAADLELPNGTTTTAGSGVTTPAPTAPAPTASPTTASPATSKTTAKTTATAKSAPTTKTTAATTRTTAATTKPAGG